MTLEHEHEFGLFGTAEPLRPRVAALAAHAWLQRMHRALTRFDPGTWTGVIQATAPAPSALEAEALARAALLRGPTAGAELLAGHGGALVLDDGELVLAGALDVATAPGAALGR